MAFDDQEPQASQDEVQEPAPRHEAPGTPISGLDEPAPRHEAPAQSGAAAPDTFEVSVAEAAEAWEAPENETLAQPLEGDVPASEVAEQATVVTDKGLDGSSVREELVTATETASFSPAATAPVPRPQATVVSGAAPIAPQPFQSQAAQPQLAQPQHAPRAAGAPVQPTSPLAVPVPVPQPNGFVPGAGQAAGMPGAGQATGVIGQGQSAGVTGGPRPAGAPRRPGHFAPQPGAASQPTAVQPSVASATPGGPGVPPAGPVDPAGASAQPTTPRSGRPFWVGLAGGLVGACVVGALWMGANALIANPLSGGDASTKTQSSGAGQVVDITTAGEDVTTAEAVAAKCLPSVASLSVTSSQGEGVGSGVVLDVDGNILTNYHVVEGAQSIVVTLNNKSYEATVVGDDESSDLAVVHIDAGDDTLTPMEVGDSSQLVVGQWVMSLGSPFGLEQSVTTGIVSSLYRSTILEGTNGNTIYTNLVQTDAAINPGNSGGALVDAQGKLVGINSTIMSTSGSSAGIGFAIPSNYAVDVANQIIAGKQVEHAYLGANVATVTAQNAALYHLAVNQGAYIVAVVDGAPAAEAGLQEGDVVTRLGDEDVTSADGLILAVRSHSVGDKVSLTYYRGSEEKTVEITLGSDATAQGSTKEPERSDSLEGGTTPMIPDQGYGRR